MSAVSTYDLKGNFIMQRIGCPIGMASIKVFFLLVAGLLEKRILYSAVSGVSRPLEEWLNMFFLYHVSLILVASLLAGLLWWVLGQLVFKVTDWKKSNKRRVWLLLFLLPVAVIVYSIAFTPQAEEGAWIVYAFYIVNGLGCYYFATAFFSPSSFKYTPLWAEKLRRW